MPHTVHAAELARRAPQEGAIRRLVLGSSVVLAALAAFSSTAQAHVKWFAPYIVDAAPQPIRDTLTNPWFWSGILLVLLFFVMAIAVERKPVGQSVLGGLDRLTGPVALRARRGALR